MANIEWVEAPASQTKGFRIGRPESLFKNGVSFTITGVKFGAYKVDGVDSKYSATSQSILLTTSVGEDLSLSRLLKGRKAVFNQDGKIEMHTSCVFQAQLRAHMEQLGRREDDPALLKGSVEDVAKHALAFFNGKTVVVDEKPVYYKDNTGKFTPGTAISFRLS